MPCIVLRGIEEGVHFLHCFWSIIMKLEDANFTMMTFILFRFEIIVFWFEIRKSLFKQFDTFNCKNEWNLMKVVINIEF